MNKEHAIGLLILLLAMVGVFAYTRHWGAPAGNGGQTSTTTPTSTNGTNNPTPTSLGNTSIWYPITINDLEGTKGPDGVYDLTKFNYPELITRGDQNNKKIYTSNFGNFELSYSDIGYPTLNGSWAYPELSSGISNEPDYLNFGGFYINSFKSKKDSFYLSQLNEIKKENTFSKNYRVRFNTFEAIASDNFTAILASKNEMYLLSSLDLSSDDFPSKIPTLAQKNKQLTEEGSYFFTVLNSIRFNE